VLTTSTAAVSTTGMIAAAAPEHLEDVLAAVSEVEHRRNREFNANTTALDGRDSRLKRMLSDVRGDITIIREDTTRITSKSIALVELNKITRLAVASNMTDFLQSVEATEVRNHQALEAYKQSITVITKAYNNAMENMQRQLQSSFDQMKHLKRTFKDVPTHVTDHLDKTVPAVIASVVNQTLPATLAIALQDTISPSLKTVIDDTITDSVASLLEGSFTEFTAKFSLIGTDMARTVCDSVASAEAPLQERYSAVQAQLEEVLTLLSDKGGAPSLVPALPARTPHVDHGGDAPDRPHFAAAASAHDAVRGGGQRHPSFHKARLPTSVSCTGAVIGSMNVPLLGALPVCLLLEDMSALPPLTLIPAMTQFWVAGLPLFASWTIPVWPEPRM
jgi:hypothetical protein